MFFFSSGRSWWRQWVSACTFLKRSWSARADIALKSSTCETNAQRLALRKTASIRLTSDCNRSPEKAGRAYNMRDRTRALNTSLRHMRFSDMCLSWFNKYRRWEMPESRQSTCAVHDKVDVSTTPNSLICVTRSILGINGILYFLMTWLVLQKIISFVLVLFIIKLCFCDQS